MLFRPAGLEPCGSHLNDRLTAACRQQAWQQQLRLYVPLCANAVAHSVPLMRWSTCRHVLLLMGYCCRTVALTTMHTHRHTSASTRLVAVLCCTMHVGMGSMGRHQWMAHSPMGGASNHTSHHTCRSGPAHSVPAAHTACLPDCLTDGIYMSYTGSVSLASFRNLLRAPPHAAACDANVHALVCDI